MVFTGGLVLFVGYISSMFATNVYHLFITYGVILGCGGALSFCVSFAHIGQYFKEKRAIATGIAMSGVGIGNFILSLIFRLLLDTYGLQGVLLAMAGLSLNVCIAGSLLRPISTYPMKNVVHFDVDHTIPRKETPRSSSLWNIFFCAKTTFKVYTLLEWSLLKKYSFVLHGMTMLCFIASFPTYVVNIPAYAEQVGHFKVKAAFLLSISGVADVIGRFCTGFIAHFHLVPTNVLMAIFAVLSVISSILTPFVTDFVPLSLITFAFTINAGAITALNPVVQAESFGAHKLASTVGITSIFMGVGILVGFPVSGKYQAQIYHCYTDQFTGAINSHMLV